MELAFEEGGAGYGKKKQSQRAFMQSYLNTLPKIVEFQEVSGDQGGDEAGDEESNSQEQAGKALAFQESEARKVCKMNSPGWTATRKPSNGDGLKPGIVISKRS